MFERSMYVVFFFNDTATTEIYTLSLHDALPILVVAPAAVGSRRGRAEDRALLAAGVGRRGGRRGGGSLAGVIEIGRAHVWNPVTPKTRMPSSGWKKKKTTSSTPCPVSHREALLR